MSDRELVEQVGAAVAEAKAQDQVLLRKWFLRVVAASVATILIAATPLAIFLVLTLTEIRDLGEATCQELLIHHRTHNEAKHYSLGANHIELGEGIEAVAGILGKDIEVTDNLSVPNAERIGSPRFCVEHGIGEEE